MSLKDDTNSYKDDIRTAVEVLKRGGLILYPTDTVWGIGCDATNPEAVERVFRLKERDDSKALITLIGDADKLWRVVDGIPDIAYELIEVTDRPLTIIYDKGVGVARNLCAEDGSLAVRVTSEPFSRSLCRAFGRPIVSTSANISGHRTPASFDQIEQPILDGVDYVCTSRRNERCQAKASAIMKLSEDGTFKLIRS